MMSTLTFSLGKITILYFICIKKDMNFAVLLQAQGQQGLIPNLIFIGLIVIVFYFFMLRPQQKKAKEQKVFKDAL
jgi:hypothetical protein